MPIIDIRLNVSNLRTQARQATAELNSIASSTDKLNSSTATAAKAVLGLVSAYQALSAVKGFVQRGIEFNSTIEQSRIGMASLIATMAKLEDAQGNVLQGAEKYAAAQELAAKMMQRIQVLGLETTATTQQLVEGVQNVMGAAMQAGMKLQEIPDFAIAAAQGMQAMGIPLQQMRTEIEALLTGDINKSQDLLAPRLGITKEVIDSWKTQGVLVEKLMEKLSAFKMAGADVAQTWKGLTSNLQEALDVVAGDVSTQMLEPLKESVKELQGFFITTEKGLPQIGKDFENVAGIIERIEIAFGDTLLFAVNGFMDAVKGVNAAIGDMGGAEAAWGSLKTSIATVTAALATMATVRKTGFDDSIRQTAQLVSSEVQLTNAVKNGEAVLLGSAEARRQQAAAAVEAAQAENAAAQAAVADAQAQLKSAEARTQNAVTSRQVSQAVTQEAAARSTLNTARERAQAASAALAASESNLAQATREAAAQSANSGAAAAAASTVWGRATNAIAAGATKVASAFKALWAGIGGGVGVAITALVSGITYLSTRQDNAARSTELLKQAQEAYSKATKNATDETGKLTGTLTQLEKAQLKIAQKQLGSSLQIQVKEISDTLTSALGQVQSMEMAFDSIAENVGESMKNAIPQEFKDSLKEAISLLEEGKIKPEEFATKLAKLREQFIGSGQGSEILVEAIDGLIAGEDKAIDKLIETSEQIDRNSAALKGQSDIVREAAGENKQLASSLESINKSQSTEIKNTKDALDWLTKRTAQTETMTAVTEANSRAKDEAALKELALAEAMAQLSVASAIAQAAISTNTEETSKAIIAAVANYEKIQQTRKQFEKGLQDVYAGRIVKKSGGGASEVESARKQVEQLKREIAELGGTASKTGNEVAAKLQTIDDLGKKAKLSASEVQELKDSYVSAFRTDTLKDFDKELLKLSGDTQALRAIEIDETVKSWEQRFAAAGLSAAEAAPKIEQLKQALSLEQSYKDLQTVADFYEKLGEMSGEYGKDIEYQNKLIEKQARAWEQAGVPLSDIAKMVELMRLDQSVDPFDGARRGLMRFSSEFGDKAKQWESITYGFASDFNDATRDMFDEFLDTGRVSFSSLKISFSQTLRDMAYQALVQPIVVSVVGGVQQGLYGMTTAAGVGGAGGTGSLGLSALTNLPIISLLPDSLTSGVGGLLGGITGGINSLGASVLPGVFAPSSSLAQSGALYNSAIAPVLGGSAAQTTLMATLGAAGAGFGLGSLGGGLLAGLVGLNSGGGSLGGGIGGALGAGIGSIVPGIGTVLGGVLGGALGSVVGGLFGGGKKKDPPELYAGYNLNLAEGSSYVYASPADNLSPVVAQQYQDYLDSIAQQALKLSSGVQTSLSSINQGLSDSYTQALSQLDAIKFSVMWEGEYIKESTMEAFGEGITQKVQKQLYDALTGMDLTPLAMAADGAVADSADELRTAISGAISFIGLGANLGDYQDDFEAEIGDKILAALNTMDTSGLRLNIDKTSLQGWQTAVAALDAWDSINATIKEIIDPTAELDAQLQTANTQFDGWIAQLRELGWQESAIAEVEAKRSVYLQQYADAVRKATQQDLSLRMIALQSGGDSWAYSSASLAVQQENELAELAKKFGTESDIYKQAQAVQQAEAAQNRLTYLQGLLEEARQEELEGLEDAASEADNLAKSFDGLADTIESTRKSYWGDDSLNLMGTAFDDLRKQFDDAYAKAMTGDEEALAELPGLSQSLLEQGKQSLSNESEYTDLFYDVDQKLKRAQEYAESQVDIQQGIYDSIQLQIQNMQQSLATQQGTKLTTEQILAEMGTLKTTIAEALEKAASYSGGRLDSSSGIYGSYYATSGEILQAKADAMNRGETLTPGQTAGGWTADKVLNKIKEAGLTIQSWYDKYGKAEGFASGGLTPRNTPFWVGENGPELMMSPHQYGVLSNPDSTALVSSYRGGYDNSAVVSEIRTQGQQSYNVLRQLLTKTNDLANQNSRILRTINMWQAEGLPETATR